MKAKISIITLAVDDLARAKQFYVEGLGLPIHGDDKEEQENIVFLELEGTWLSLYPREKLAEDVGIDATRTGFSGVTLAHNVSTEREVEEVLERAKNAGATIVKPGQSVFWGGYSGYFTDPDGHLWEVAHNPFTDLT
jgi:hypothetical protein